MAELGDSSTANRHFRPEPGKGGNLQPLQTWVRVPEMFPVVSCKRTHICSRGVSAQGDNYFFCSLVSFFPFYFTFFFSFSRIRTHSCTLLLLHFSLLSIFYFFFLDLRCTMKKLSFLSCAHVHVRILATYTHILTIHIYTHTHHTYIHALCYSCRFDDESLGFGKLRFVFVCLFDG